VPVRSPESLELAASKEAVVRRMLDALPGRGPVAGTYRGRDEVIGLFRALAGLFDAPLEMASHDVVASEAHVVDLATYSGVRGGQSFTWNTVRLYHVDDDRIAEIWLMIGDIYAFDAFVE